MKNQFSNMSSMKSQFSNTVKLIVFICALGLIALNVWWFPISVMDLNLVDSNDAPSSSPLTENNRVKNGNSNSNDAPSVIEQKEKEEEVSASENYISVSAEDLALAANYCSTTLKAHKSCDFNKGKWVYDPSPPLYTNATCKYIFRNQDCIKNGRPDTDYLHWRWQPEDCDLPRFDPKLFLQLMAHKSMVFVGDSLARNQKDALLCALSQIEDPTQVWHLYKGMESVHVFPSYNFTVALAWSPFLVNYTVEDKVWHIHLDKPHPLWADPLSNFDVSIFSYYYWIYRLSVYYKDNKNFTTYDPEGTSGEHVDAMKTIWNTVMQHLVHNYSGVAILRTVSTDHFEGNPWDKGGTCNKTKPYSKSEAVLPYMHNLVRTMQLEAFQNALKSLEEVENGPTLKLLDVTYSTSLRPDGHPSTYRVQTSYEPRNDCVHWCVPGPIDSWNQMILADSEIMCS